MLAFDVSQYKRTIKTIKGSIYCGDFCLILEDDSMIFLAVFDGSGHGKSAFEVTKVAMNYLEQESEEDLCLLLKNLHEILKGSLGGVAGLCRINKATAMLSYSGIGNISTRLFTPDSQHLISRDGVLGHRIVEPKLYEHQLHAGNALMLYSDGVNNMFRLTDLPVLRSSSAEELARFIIDHLSKDEDDAACIVLKVLNG